MSLNNLEGCPREWVRNIMNQLKKFQRSLIQIYSARGTGRRNHDESVLKSLNDIRPSYHDEIGKTIYTLNMVP